MNGTESVYWWLNQWCGGEVRYVLVCCHVWDAAVGRKMWKFTLTIQKGYFFLQTCDISGNALQSNSLVYLLTSGRLPIVLLVCLYSITLC